MDVMERTREVEPRPASTGIARVLWRLFGGILVVAGLVWGAYNVITVLAHESRVETASFAAGDLTALDVRNSAGPVRIVGTDTDEVTVVAEVHDGLRATGFSQEVVGSTLELRGSCPNFGSDWCRVDYEITIPRSLDVLVHADDGTIDVRDVDGTVDVDGDNGSIELSGLAGIVLASNDDGRIEGLALRASHVEATNDNGRVTLVFSEPPTTVIADTDNGSLEVVVPDTGETYAVDMETDNGDEDNTIPTAPDSSRTITLQTDNGSITARTAG
jgi:hypothetical protein